MGWVRVPLPPVLFSFNAAKSGRCLQRKIKVPRSLAVCLSVGFLFLALSAFSFFLPPSSASLPSSLPSSTRTRRIRYALLRTNRIEERFLSEEAELCAFMFKLDTMI